MDLCMVGSRVHRDGYVLCIEDERQMRPVDTPTLVTPEECLGEVCGRCLTRCLGGKVHTTGSDTHLALRDTHILWFCWNGLHSPFILWLIAEISSTHRRRSVCSSVITWSCGQ
jgi:hypothetical protein